MVSHRSLLLPQRHNSASLYCRYNWDWPLLMAILSMTITDGQHSRTLENEVNTSTQENSVSPLAGPGFEFRTLNSWSTPLYMVPHHFSSLHCFHTWVLTTWVHYSLSEQMKTNPTGEKTKAHVHRILYNNFWGSTDPLDSRYKALCSSGVRSPVRQTPCSLARALPSPKHFRVLSTLFLLTLGMK